MAIFTADVEGLDELMKALSGMADEAMPYIHKAATEAGNAVLQAAKDKIPVDTGTAQKALKLRKMAVKPNKNVLFHSVTYTGTKKGASEGGAHHITPLELGHKLKINGKIVGKVEAKPFLRPAADENKSKTVETVIKHLNEAIDKIGGNK